jgi:uncharacterized protein
LAYKKNMQMISEEIENLNWPEITENLNQKGFAQINRLITDSQCDNLKYLYTQSSYFRKTIVMERYRFGLGEYKYFQYPLPELIQEIRENIYTKIAPIANKWMQLLNIKTIFPAQLAELHAICEQNNQTKPTVLMLKYGKGGFNTLHQDLYGEVFFPFQMVLFLNEPQKDFEGGEFVLTEQIPRAQSKAIVLKPKKGEALIFTTNFRPIKGTKGYYRAKMRHGVAEVIDGERHTLGIIFHDATT